MLFSPVFKLLFSLRTVNKKPLRNFVRSGQPIRKPSERISETCGNFVKVFDFFHAQLSVSVHYTGGDVVVEVILNTGTGTIAESLLVVAALMAAVFQLDVVVGDTQRADEIETVAADGHIAVQIQTVGVKFRLGLIQRAFH